MSKSKSTVVARLTVTREIGVKTIIEVHEDATFSKFFHFFTQEGRRRSTKRPIRTANRNEGLRPYFQAYRIIPGLEVLASQFEAMQHIQCVKLRIIKKGAYRRLISAPPEQLGLVKVQPVRDRRLEPMVLGIAVRIPVGHTTIEKKWSILTSRRKVPA
jgi:hypothetical protein